MRTRTEPLTRFKPSDRGPAHAGPSSCQRVVHTTMELFPSTRPTMSGCSGLDRQRQNLLNAVQFGSEFRQADMYGK